MKIISRKTGNQTFNLIRIVMGFLLMPVQDDIISFLTLNGNSHHYFSSIILGFEIPQNLTDAKIYYKYFSILTGRRTRPIILIVF